MRKVKAKADPAPSRWSYRMQRILLTPAYRMAARVGIPFAISAGLVMAYMSDEKRSDEVMLFFADARRSFETSPQFMVGLMAVDGASQSTEEDIREIAAIDFPVSSFDLDLEGLRAAISDLPSVASASLRVRNGGVLEVSVSERVPAVVWRAPDGLALIDSEGVVVGGLDSRFDRPDLPLIAGIGAENAVPEALEIIAAAAPVEGRVRGLLRVGKRRWDVVMDRNQRIMLPEEGPVQAQEQAIALDQAQDMLERDLATVDLRLARRPTVRMNPAASENWWKIKDIIVEAGGQ